jgi:hypothetical protein
MKVFIAVLFLALTQNTVPRNAPDTKVFGIQMGGELAIPECPIDTSGKYSLAPAKRLCFMNTGEEMKTEHTKIEALIAGTDNHTKKRKMSKDPQQSLSSYGPVNSGRVYLDFPLNDQPAMSKGNLLAGWMLDGKLEEIEFSTIGVNDYQLMLDELTKKYGTPTWMQPTEVQNVYGAKLKSGIVGWSFSNLGVVFQGTWQRLDEGRVTISTPKGKSAADARDKAKAGTPL